MAFEVFGCEKNFQHVLKRKKKWGLQLYDGAVRFKIKGKGCTYDAKMGRLRNAEATNIRTDLVT